MTVLGCLLTVSATGAWFGFVFAIIALSLGPADARSQLTGTALGVLTLFMNLAVGLHIALVRGLFRHEGRFVAFCLLALCFGPFGWFASDAPGVLFFGSLTPNSWVPFPRGRPASGRALRWSLAMATAAVAADIAFQVLWRRS